MRQYIVELTNALIGQNNLDFARDRMRDDHKFVRYATEVLEAGAVREMRPETLGKILCELEVGDVMTSREELLGGLFFSGNCEELLRQLTAKCLAYVIRDRLTPSGADLVPQFKRQLKRPPKPTKR